MAGNSRPTIGHPAAGDAPAGGRVLPLEPPIRIAISRAEQDHHAELRRRSYELAVARGHINRWPA